MSPRVSVILPVHNREQSLANSMRSVLDQCIADIELIVVDDASQADLKPIVESFNDPRVVYIRREQNGGASIARNTGLAAAKGAFIAFQDSDDLWLPGKLKRQLDFLEQTPEYGAVTGSKILYGSGPDGKYGQSLVSMRPSPHKRLMPGEDQVRKFLVENRISLQNAMFRRTCYPTIQWFDPVTRSNADWAFTSSLAQHCRIAEDPEPVVVAFSSKDSISKNQRNKAIGMIRILKRNRAVYEKYSPEYGTILFRIARVLSRAGKARMARRFYFESMRRNPQVLFDAAKERLRKILRPQKV